MFKKLLKRFRNKEESNKKEENETEKLKDVIKQNNNQLILFLSQMELDPHLYSLLFQQLTFFSYVTDKTFNYHMDEAYKEFVNDIENNNLGKKSEYVDLNSQTNYIQ